MKGSLLILALIAVCAGGAQALTMTFTGQDAWDTTIASVRMPSGYHYAPSILNYGKSDRIMTRGTVSKGLLRFDVSALNGVADVIIDVTLRLHVNSGEGTVNVYRISDANSGWEEGSAAGSGGMWPIPGNNATTWRSKAQTHLWAGGFGLPQSGTDFDPVPLTTFNTTGSVGSYVDIPLGGDLTELITTWSNSSATSGVGSFSVSQGANTANEGMLLVSDGTSVYFSSAESANMPELIVTYGSAPVVPAGSFDGDMDIDADDIDLMGDYIRTGIAPTAANYDLSEDGVNGGTDGTIDIKDMDYLVRYLVETSAVDGDGNPIFGTQYGDFNLDGEIELGDLTRLGTYYGVGDKWSEGNANRYLDEDIELGDLTILGTYYGASNGGVDAIPEPMTMSLLALGGLAVLKRRSGQAENSRSRVDGS